MGIEQAVQTYGWIHRSLEERDVSLQLELVGGSPRLQLFVVRRCANSLRGIQKDVLPPLRFVKVASLLCPSAGRLQVALV